MINLQSRILLLLLLFSYISCQFGNKSDRRLFNEFRKKFGKKYKTQEELQFRFNIFKKNLALLQIEPEFTGPNGERLVGTRVPRVFSGAPPKKKKFKKGINQFIDITDDEFREFYLLPKNRLYRNSEAQIRPPNYNKIKRTRLGSAFKQPKRLVGGFVFPQNNRERRLQEDADAVLGSIPKKLDWVAQGKVTKVKNQSKCNSCYVFSANAAVESHYLIKYNKEILISEQEILDCDKGNYGCIGGQPSAVMKYIIDNQISFEKDYPYLAKERSKCYANEDVVPEEATNERRLQESDKGNWQKGRYRYRYENADEFDNDEIRPARKPNQNANQYEKFLIKHFKDLYADNGGGRGRGNGGGSNKRKKFNQLVSYKFVNENIMALLEAVQQGPVTVAFFVSESFKFYSEGVFDGEGCDTGEYVNHSVILTGYDLDAEVPYFSFKNSWSTLWGDKGYFKMAIGQLSFSNKGLCLLADNPFNIVPEIS